MTVYTKQWNKEKKKVANAQTALNKANKTNSAILSKKKSYKASVDADQKKIDEMKKGVNYYQKKGKWVKRKKSKPLTKKQSAEIDKLQKDATKNNTKLNNAAFKKKVNNAENAVKNAKKVSTKAKTARDSYEKLRHQTALKRIAAERKLNYEQYLAPHASIHATNSMTGLEVFLFASTEAESNESEATTYPIDRDDPVVDHVRRTGKTITVTGWLFDQSKTDRIWAGKVNDVSGAGLTKKTVQQQFANLRKWQFDGTELVYKSDWVKKSGFNHIYYKHLYMTSLEKTLDAPYKGGVQISITFQFAYKARVATKKKKKNGGKKGPGNKKGGSKKVKKITVKYGMTYWGLAKKWKTTVTQLRKWNGSEKKTMYPDKKTGKYPNKLRVR